MVDLFLLHKNIKLQYSHCQKASLTLITLPYGFHVTCIFSQKVEQFNSILFSLSFESRLLQELCSVSRYVLSFFFFFFFFNNKQSTFRVMGN